VWNQKQIKIHKQTGNYFFMYLKQDGQWNFLENFQKKNLSHFEEKSYEIIKIFGRFGQISSF